MKALKTMAFALVAFFLFQTAKAQKAEWKELKDFHSVMSKSFHPAEEGNLQPVKDNAGELVAKVKAWQSAVVPAGFKADETKKVLTELTAKCQEINKAVIDKKDDKELKALITQAHDIFHQIAEKCRQPEAGK